MYNGGIATVRVKSVYPSRKKGESKAAYATRIEPLKQKDRTFVKDLLSLDKNVTLQGKSWVRASNVQQNIIYYTKARALLLGKDWRKDPQMAAFLEKKIKT